MQEADLLAAKRMRERVRERERERERERAGKADGLWGDLQRGASSRVLRKREKENSVPREKKEARRTLWVGSCVECEIFSRIS